MDYPRLVALRNDNVCLYTEALNDILSRWVDWNKEIKQAVVSNSTGVLQWILETQTNYDKNLTMPIEYCGHHGLVDALALLRSHGFAMPRPSSA